ncbi:MAG TPA: phosphoglycerate kinase [Patescibacteria group bacterium]|nr:phosphoglycerate kinase [Patescibacteria group bacterium]
MLISSIAHAHIRNKRVLVRVDYNVSLTDKGKIADDVRISQTIPTIKLLLKNHNRLILISHLGEPKNRDPKFSLHPVAKDLQEYFPSHKIIFVDDFLSEKGKKQLTRQKRDEILLLENVRFYPGEKANNITFARQLATLADIYVNDAFGVSHRKDASVVSLPKLLPHFAGLLMEKEVQAIGLILNSPKKPVVAIIGGAKVSTKIPLLYKLTEIADYLLLGGGIATTFLYTQGFEIGKSFFEKDQKQEVKKILVHARNKKTIILLPRDTICASAKDATDTTEIAINHLPKEKIITDIGSETEAIFGNIIAQANTIVWNGPVGYTEYPLYSRGTEFLYYAITQNPHCYSVVGGGDTLAAISKKEYVEKISHISTGGGAMLEFIEKGTLPGIEALKEKYL